MSLAGHVVRRAHATKLLQGAYASFGKAPALNMTRKRKTFKHTLTADGIYIRGCGLAVAQN